ncbi:MAG: hypothetical protein Q8877_03260 [Sweet potato little leaf phytoplasma]|nr:hypothetical protein [Sweet potato little leaf phytoplasma]
MAAVQPPPPAPVEIDWPSRFRKSEPKSFEGGYDPDGTQKWLQEIEKILHSLQTPAEHRVRFSEYMLTGEAEHWWDQVRKGMEATDQAVTWEIFRARFLGKYKVIFI